MNILTRNTFGSIARIAVAPALAAGLFLAYGTQARADDATSVLRQVSVTGEAVASVQPDIARVLFATRSRQASADMALAANTEDAIAVRAALASLGLADADIATREISISAVSDPGENAAFRIAGYDAVNLIEVTVHDLGQIGEILDRAVAAGADTIEGLTFDSTQRDAVSRQVRDAAAADAAAQARALGAALGFEVKGVIDVQSRRSAPLPMMMRKESFAGGPVPVSPGSLEIRETVDVRFEIVNAMQDEGTR